jgi:hypothetical protein
VTACELNDWGSVLGLGRDFSLCLLLQVGCGAAHALSYAISAGGKLVNCLVHLMLRFRMWGTELIIRKLCSSAYRNFGFFPLYVLKYNMPLFGERFGLDLWTYSFQNTLLSL